MRPLTKYPVAFYGRCDQCGIKTPREVPTLFGRAYRCVSCSRLITRRLKAHLEKTRAYFAEGRV